MIKGTTPLPSGISPKGKNWGCSQNIEKSGSPAWGEMPEGRGV
jgi:hypothetical protein